MPLPVVLAHRLTSLLTLARMTDTIHGIGPDGKAQVTVEYAVNEPDHEDARCASLLWFCPFSTPPIKIRTSWRRN